jgi:hypothetical protein
VVFRQEIVEVPPVKLAAWQVWQVLKPVTFATFGANFAAAPWEAGASQPAGWPS